MLAGDSDPDMRIPHLDAMLITIFVCVLFFLGVAIWRLWP